MKRNRYPGLNPFETADKDCYFGRTQEVEDLCDLIVLEPIAILYGKSGYGKSSLINAGIIPALLQEPNLQERFIPLRIRFGAYIEGRSQSPLQTLLARLEEAVPPEPKMFFLDECLPTQTLWYHFKRRQLPAGRRFMLLFDQFEEFFTYPIVEQNQFKAELVEVLHLGIPQKIRNLTEHLFLAQRELLVAPMEVHTLFAVREDRLSLLDNMRDYFPGILNKRFGLKALSRESAIEAIVKPAHLPGDHFVSPVFDYTVPALDEILEELAEAGPSQRTTIEAFQLQIVCQHIENQIIRGKIRDATGDQILDVQLDDLPEISKIYEEYYKNQIEQLPPTVQDTARNLIEEGLILEDPATGETRRLSLDRDLLIKQFNLSGKQENLLALLENTFLIRREANTLGGFSFEISHDTLIAPILKNKRQRFEEEAKEKERALLLHQIEEIKKSSLRRRKRMVRITGLTLVAMVALILSNWNYFLFSVQTVTRGQEVPVLDNRDKLNFTISLLAQQLSKEAHQLRQDPSMFFGSPWACSQVMTALDGKVNDIPYSDFLEVFKIRMIDSCCCWSEVSSLRDLRASGWINGALYRSGLDSHFSCDISKFILNNQLGNGAWSMVARDESKDQLEELGSYGSTYATCHALLSLQYIQKGDTARILTAIENGTQWLLSNRQKVNWRDYPNVTRESTMISKSISGLAIHTLNALGKSSPELNRTWLDQLDMADAVLAMDFKEQSDVYYRFYSGIKSIDYFHDATRHVVQPWQIIATVDAYKDGTLQQKIKANQWLSKVVGNIEPDKLKEQFSFFRAEVLIALRYLGENKIRI